MVVCIAGVALIHLSLPVTCVASVFSVSASDIKYGPGSLHEVGDDADALGITTCLYAYSHLSFSDGRFARVCACHYHRLREFMLEHPEVAAILGATD